MRNTVRKTMTALIIGAGVLLGAVSPAGASPSPVLDPVGAVRVALENAGFTNSFSGGPVKTPPMPPTGPMPSNPLPSGPGDWNNLDWQRAKLVEEINRTRIHDGQRPVIWAQAHNGGAQNWAEVNAAAGRLHHASSGFDGEIIVMLHQLNDTTAARMVDLWNHSRGHHKIMHDNAYAYVTVGIAQDNRTGAIYGVARFFRPNSSWISHPAG